MESTLPEEADARDYYFEGATIQVAVNAYERDRNAVKKCKAHHGNSCTVCKFALEEIYGDLGKGYVHVHHRRPLAKIGRRYQVDPIKDLCPVCPNCHAMLHRTDPPMRPEQLRKLIRNVQRRRSSGRRRSGGRA